MRNGKRKPVTEVYLLHHLRAQGDDEDVKLIGVYRSETSAGAAIAPISPSRPCQRVPHVPDLAAVKETQRIGTPELQIKPSQPTPVNTIG